MKKYKWEEEFQELLSGIAFGGSEKVVEELKSFVRKLVAKTKRQEALKWHKIIKEMKRK